MKIVIQILLIIAMSTAAYAVDIDSCGTLSSAGTTYVLQNDVVANGTCFTLAANDIVIDLNGKTVTYDNAPPISVPNYGFEAALSGTWDTSSAPNATRAEGSLLTSTLYKGSYALKFSTPCANQTVQSVDEITLQPNTKYSISGMVYNQVSDAIRISVSFDGTAHSATQSSRTWRGFQYIRAVFTTGASVEAYKINLTVTDASGVVSGAVYFDDIRVQQAEHYGVVSPGISSRNPTVKNGTIRQGQARGDFSHNLSMSLIPGVNPAGRFVNLNMYVWGNSCKAIWANYLTNAVFANNTIDSDVETIAVRDYYDGSLIHSGWASSNGVIANNTILDGIQTAIKVESASAANRMQIYGNTISLNSTYTNDFAIVSYDGYGNIIHDNVVDCVSNDGSCRGIYMSSNGGEIYNNTVSVQYKSQNQEYGGCGGVSYGLQLEQKQVNATVYGNTVTAVADECNAVAFRYFGPADNSTLGNNIYKNTFKSIVANGSSAYASVVAVLQTYKQHMTFTNNTLETNSNWFSTGQANVADELRSTELTGNFYKLVYPKASFYHPIFSGTYANGDNHPRNVSLVENTYSDATAKSDLEESGVYGYHYINGPDTFAYNILVTGDAAPVDPDPEDPDPEDPDPTPTTSGPILRTGSSLLRVGDGVLRVQ